jgi:hypothetical protein
LHSRETEHLEVRVRSPSSHHQIQRVQWEEEGAAHREMDQIDQLLSERTYWTLKNGLEPNPSSLFQKYEMERASDSSVGTLSFVEKRGVSL